MSDQQSIRFGSTSRRQRLPKTSTYRWKKLYGHEFLYGAPLFMHQLSHLWIDFRGIQDAFMRRQAIDYFENSRRATSSGPDREERETTGVRHSRNRLRERGLAVSARTIERAVPDLRCAERVAQLPTVRRGCGYCTGGLRGPTAVRLWPLVDLASGH